MEATKEQIQGQQEQQDPQIQDFQEQPKTQSFGNKVPNTFEELNAMRQNQKPYLNTLNKTQSSFAQHGNTILQSSSTQFRSKEDPVNRFAKSMNLPKDVSIVKMPKSVDKKKYQIPPSEYIWDAPYLKKTQIFPSYVRNII